jgi:hypothetical protein
MFCSFSGEVFLSLFGFGCDFRQVVGKKDFIHLALEVVNSLSTNLFK